MPWAAVNGVAEYVIRIAPSAGSVRARARIVRPMEVVGGSGMSRASRAASAAKLRAWKQNVRQSVCTVCRTRGGGISARARRRAAMHAGGGPGARAHEEALEAEGRGHHSVLGDVYDRRVLSPRIVPRGHEDQVRPRGIGYQRKRARSASRAPRAGRRDSRRLSFVVRVRHGDQNTTGHRDPAERLRQARAVQRELGVGVRDATPHRGVARVHVATFKVSWMASRIPFPRFPRAKWSASSGQPRRSQRAIYGAKRQ